MSTVRANTYLDATGGSNAVFSGVASPPNSMGFRNRIINGDMRIDQRNNGASVTYPGGGGELYVVDRWAGNSTGSTRFSMQRSTTAPAGFTNSLLITTTTAGTPGSGDFCYFVHHVEGFNVADLGFGTASAQAVTLSFWVRSSLTGTFGGSIANSAANRRYPFNFVISAANTWEYKTVTIPGDTTGTWLTDNGRGIVVSLNLGSGSANKGTAGAWATSGMAPSGTVDLVATSAATLNITGVQLEAGTVASPFERRDYGRELMMCQRYLPIANGSSIAAYVGLGQAAAAVTVINYIYKVTPRVIPTGIIVSSPSHFSIYNGLATSALSAIAFGQASLDMCTLSCTNVTSLTAGTSAGMYFTSASAQIQFTGCEL